MTRSILMASNYGASTATILTNTDVIWCQWNNAMNSATTSVTTDIYSGIWGQWCNAAQQQQAAGIGAQQQAQAATANNALGVQQAFINAQQEREYRLGMNNREDWLRTEEQLKAKEEAAAKARQLLVDNLTSAQRKELEATRAFTVHGPEDKIYLVRYGRAGNITEITKDGCRIATYCVHPDVDVPVYDVMLAQKLMIEHDHAGFLKTANRRVLAVTA